MASAAEGSAQPFGGAFELLTETERVAFDEWFQGNNKIKIMVAGKSGAGKSTLLNKLIGRSFTQVGGGLSSTTQRIIPCRETIRIADGYDIEVKLFDCPGLLDDQHDTNREYITMMKEAIGEDNGIDVLLYCIQMTETRSDLSIHRSAMQTISREFPGVWKNAVVVLTFANVYAAELADDLPDDPSRVLPEFKQLVDAWKEEVNRAINISASTTSDTAIHVPVHPSGYKRVSLPGIDNWLSSLWCAVISATAIHAQALMISATTDGGRRFQESASDRELRLDTPPIITTPQVRETIGSIATRVLKISVYTRLGAQIGFGVGKVLGGLDCSPGSNQLGGIVGARVGAKIGHKVGIGVGVVCALIVASFLSVVRKEQI